MRTLQAALVASLVILFACGEKEPPAEPKGGIDEVVVVLKGHDDALPFDPRGGRLTIVTRELQRILGHPVVFELDTALSPELKVTLEESVLASFETLTRELVLLQKDDAAMFDKARRLERVVFVYDAVAKESSGELRSDGTVLDVRSPPDRFPLLEQWLVTSAVYQAFVADLDARWGEADPTKLSARDQTLWFDYMTQTRPGAGYLWVAARAKRGGSWEALRAEHLERVLALGGVVDARSALGRRVRRFLLEHASYAGDLSRGTSAERTARAYERWLTQSVRTLDDEEQLMLEHVLFDHAESKRAFPSFDRMAFGLGVLDAWTKDGARLEQPATARGKLFKEVVCPVKRRPVDDPDGGREIRYGCSGFFAWALEDEGARRQLAETITKRHDSRLLELALLNLGSKGGVQAVALVESLTDDALFRHGVSVLFHDLARRDDVKSALEAAAPRWWHDAPARRGLALLVLARGWEHLDPHYGDHQATRFAAEYGGPVQRDVLAAFLAEGTRAVEMAPRVWVALAKSGERDALVAKSLPTLLAYDRDARTSRTRPVLVLLRKRLCDEKNAAGMATMRTELERWKSEHPDDGAAVSNAIQDFTLARCKKPSEPE